MHAEALTGQLPFERGDVAPEECDRLRIVAHGHIDLPKVLSRQNLEGEVADGPSDGERLLACRDGLFVVPYQPERVGLVG